MSVPHIDEADLPQDGLYHYTNAGGLYGILTDEKLWATHAAYLNDSQEFLFGMGLIQEELKNFERELKVMDTSSDPEFSDLVAMMPPAISRGLQLELQERAAFLRQKAGPFVTCLSAARDQLSQWRGYGAGGGYAIRFDAADLRKSLDGYTAPVQIAPEQIDIFAVPIMKRRLIKMERRHRSDSVRPKTTPSIRRQIPGTDCQWNQRRRRHSRGACAGTGTHPGQPDANCVIGTSNPPKTSRV